MDTQGTKWRRVNELNEIKLEEPGQTLEGKLTRCKRVKMAKRTAWLFTFQKPDGSYVDLWGSAILDQLREIPIGTAVRIEYLGMTGGDSGYEYKDYSIQVPEGVKLLQVEDDIPF